MNRYFSLRDEVLHLLDEKVMDIIKEMLLHICFR